MRIKEISSKFTQKIVGKGMTIGDLFELGELHDHFEIQ